MSHKKTGFGLTRIKVRQGGFVQRRIPETVRTVDAENHAGGKTAPIGISECGFAQAAHTALDTNSRESVPARP
jgi:hypothetical protein